MAKYLCERGHLFKHGSVVSMLICRQCLLDSIRYADVTPIHAPSAQLILNDIDRDSDLLTKYSEKLVALSGDELRSLSLKTRDVILRHELNCGTLDIRDGATGPRVILNVFKLKVGEQTILLCASALGRPALLKGDREDG